MVKGDDDPCILFDLFRFQTVFIHPLKMSGGGRARAGDQRFSLTRRHRSPSSCGIPSLFKENELQEIIVFPALFLKVLLKGEILIEKTKNPSKFQKLIARWNNIGRRWRVKGFENPPVSFGSPPSKG